MSLPLETLQYEDYGIRCEKSDSNTLLLLGVSEHRCVEGDHY